MDRADITAGVNDVRERLRRIVAEVELARNEGPAPAAGELRGGNERRSAARGGEEESRENEGGASP